MIFRKTALAFCFLLLSITCWGTIIKIKDSSYANIPLRIYVYENLLTHNRNLLTTATVNAQGEAEISIPLKESQLVYIPILSFELVFYAEPNATVTLKLPNYQQLKKAFSQLKSYTKQEIPLFTQEEKSLNRAINHYDKDYNKFIKANFKAIYNKKSPKKYREQLTNLRTLYGSTFFKNYTAYKEAYVDYIAGLRNELLPTYYANKKLQLHNTAYVSLLRKLTKELAIDFPRNPRYTKVYKDFLKSKTYNGLKKVYKNLAATNDANFNEHFFIYIMRWALQEKLVPQAIVFKKLQLIAKYSPNRINKKLAKSILKKKQFKGKKAPLFNLKTTDGKTYTNKILTADKPTLIAFFDSASSNSASIKALHGMQSKYKDAFNVIVFSCEKKIEELPKNWRQFTVPYHSYLLSDYRLGRFPYYILITADGKIAKQTWQQYLISLEK